MAITDADRQAEAWTRKVVLDVFARDVSRVANELERQAGHARELLANAKPTKDNAFKLPLAERTLGLVLAQAKE